MRHARHVAGTAALVAGDATAAIIAGRAAMAADRFDEAAHRLLMCAYYVNHEPARALLTYERLRSMLADELGTDPARVTRDLQLAILKHDTLPLAAMLSIHQPARVPAGR